MFLYIIEDLNKKKMMWICFKIIIVSSVYICNWVLAGNPILEAVPYLNECVQFLTWCIDYIFPNIEAYVEQLSRDEREILADILENLRDMIREFADGLPRGHWLINPILHLSNSLVYVIDFLRRD
jgi:hypothetical protein